MRQIEAEPRRRWFTDEDLDLVVWFDEKNRIIGFQLCYAAGGVQKALTWHEERGYLHSGVDDGEGRDGHYKATPILIPDGSFDREAVGERFAAAGRGLPGSIARRVKALIKVAAFSCSGW